MAKTLLISNTDLVSNKRFSFLTEDVVSTGTTFRVQSILGFQSLTTSSGQIVLMGKIGEERTELLRTSSTTAPSQAYKEITLRDSMNFDHPQDTVVTIVDWNRADIQWSATLTGTKSTLEAYPVQIQPDALDTVYVDTQKSSGYYFIRLNESIGNTNSDFSDPIQFSGTDDNSVLSIKKRAVDSVGETIDGVTITHDFLNSSLWDARREYHMAPGKRPFRRKFNAVIGTALTGSYRIELPTDVENPYTDENIYGVRIGTSQNLINYDKKRWDMEWIGRPRSSLALPYVKGTSTSIWLNSGNDFADSGSISVEGTSVGVTRITGSTNSFTITSHGSWSASGGSDAYQNVSYGLPTCYTVFADPGGSAYIYFNRPIDTAYINQNIYVDYYRTILGFDSDGDLLDEPNFDMFVNYLAAKIKNRKTRGAEDITKDADYKLWLMKKQMALDSEILHSDITLNPGISHLQIPN